jgi:hypothetical protein
MPAPLPESVVAILRNPVAALSALLVISGVHRELFAFAAQTIGVDAPGQGSYFERRLARRDSRRRGIPRRDEGFAGRCHQRVGEDDQQSKTSTGQRAAPFCAPPLATNEDRSWVLVEESASREPATLDEPLRAAKASAHAHG